MPGSRPVSPYPSRQGPALDGAAWGLSPCSYDAAMLTRGWPGRVVLLTLAIALVVPAEAWAAGIGPAATGAPADVGGGADADRKAAAVIAQAEEPWGVDPAIRDRFVAG